MPCHFYPHPDIGSSTRLVASVRLHLQEACATYEGRQRLASISAVGRSRPRTHGRGEGETSTNANAFTWLCCFTGLRTFFACLSRFAMLLHWAEECSHNDAHQSRYETDSLPDCPQGEGEDLMESQSSLSVKELHVDGLLEENR